MSVGNSEDTVFWAGFLRSLKERGLAWVLLVTSDANPGLRNAVTRVFQEASWQRCWVHFVRSFLGSVAKADVEMVAALSRSVFTQGTKKAVGGRWGEAGDVSRGQGFVKAAEMMDDAKQDVLAFSVFLPAHWRKIRSNNLLERLNKEIKRRSGVVGIFPNDVAVTPLVGAVLADQHDEWIIGKRCLSETSMAELAETHHTENAQLKQR